MKAVISTTFDDKYFFFLPIICFAWNKLGVDVICFAPNNGRQEFSEKLQLMTDVFSSPNKNRIVFFNSKPEKTITYAQLSRLFVSCVKGLDRNEIAFTSDIDMIVFKLPPHNSNFDFTVYGADLTPNTQYPVCYIAATVKKWGDAFNSENRLLQSALDFHLGHIECENMRGNYWSYEQEQIFNTLQKTNNALINRAKPNTQFATNRYDRDDAYLLDRLSLDTFDYHLPRPGYEENNFNQILTVLKFHYPNENLDWLINYRNEYIKLL